MLDAHVGLLYARQRTREGLSSGDRRVQAWRRRAGRLLRGMAARLDRE